MNPTSLQNGDIDRPTLLRNEDTNIPILLRNGDLNKHTKRGHKQLYLNATREREHLSYNEYRY